VIVLRVMRFSTSMYPRELDAGRHFSIELGMLASVEAKGSEDFKDGSVERLDRWMSFDRSYRACVHLT